MSNLNGLFLKIYPELDGWGGDSPCRTDRAILADMFSVRDSCR